MKAQDKTGLESWPGDQEGLFPESEWQHSRGSEDDSYLQEERYAEHVDLGLLTFRVVKMDFSQVPSPSCVVIASLDKNPIPLMLS